MYLSRAKASRRLARLVAPAIAVAMIGFMPATRAVATGGGVENFTMTGGWTCTGCDFTGDWGIQGNSIVCQETEAEAAVGGRIDVPPTVACNGAVFVGGIHALACVAGTCVEQGFVNFYIPDASDAGNVIGPIAAQLTGVAVQVAAAPPANEQVWVLTASLEALGNYPTSTVTVWGVGGELEGGACAGSLGRCAISQSFTATLAGVDVDT